MPSPMMSGTFSRAAARRIAPPPTGPSDRRGSRKAAFAAPSVCNHVRWIATGPNSTCSTSATITGRLPPSGCRNQDRDDADRRWDRQIAKAPDRPIALDNGPFGVIGFLPPEVERLGDPLRASLLLGFAPTFQFGGIGRPRLDRRHRTARAGATRPAIFPRAPGVAVRDQPPGPSRSAKVGPLE